MGSGTDGIEWQAFESILYFFRYGKHRAGKAKADLDKCRCWLFGELEIS